MPTGPKSIVLVDDEKSYTDLVSQLLADNLNRPVHGYTRPLDALHTPLWALRGKASLKREVTARVVLDVEHLPYNRPLLEYLMAERGEGRKLYLATGADSGLADRIAQHLNLFAGVLSSDGATNNIGSNKLAGFRARFAGDFDYIGNARPDLPLLAAALIGLRHGAPARPVLAGALAGLMSAGLAATLYASHCTDDSPLFVMTWYSLGTALVTAIGALAGSKLLRF